jgi:K+-sensing histidine kinase KdpD
MESLDHLTLENALPGKSPDAISQEGDLSTLKRAFIERITHDVQGSFFGVGSLCITLKNAIDNHNDPTELLDPMMEACQWYRFKLRNFLEFTRSEAGLRGTSSEPIQIRKLIQKVIDEFQFLALENITKVNLSVSTDIPLIIFSDENRLVQIAANLISNAIAFSELGRTISIAVEKELPLNLVMLFEDNGEGMTREQIESVFSLSLAKRKILNNPSGLGLIVTKYLVEDVLGGRITITSQPQVGTCCKVTLPLKER